MIDQINLKLWERNFVLDIFVQNYPDEDIIPNQEHIVEMIPNVDFEKTINPLILYIRENYASDLNEIHPEDLNCDSSNFNIFRYIIPKSILIPRSMDENVFSIMCDFRFDIEHGLALVFKNGILDLIGSQDIIL